MSNITCQKLAELITAYLDEVLDPELARRFCGHLAECAGCRCYLDQFRRTIRCLGEVAVRTIPDDVRRSLLQAFRGEPHLLERC